MSNNTNLSKELQKDKIGMGLGAFGYNLGAAGVITYLTFFYTDYMLIPAASVALILLFSRFLDAFTDLLVGILIDRTKSKHGKVRPWLLWIAVPAIISVAATYYIPNLSETGRTIYAFITYNLMAFFYLTAMALPMQALCSVITTDSGNRLKLSQIYGFFNTLAAVFLNLFAAKIMAFMGGGASGYFYYFGTVALIGGLLMLACFKLTKERTEKAVSNIDKIPLGKGLKAIFSNGYWWILTFMQVMVMFVPAMWAVTAYYCIYWLNGQVDVGALMSLMWGGITIGVLAFIPITRKVGKAKSAAIGFIFQIIGSVLLIIAPSAVAMAWISTIFRAFGAGANSGVANALRADVVEYGEWKTGLRTEGLVYSGASFGMKVGAGIGGAVVAALLAWGEYIPGAASQAPKAMDAIKFAFVYCPLIGTIITIICLIFLIGLEKKIPQIKADLDERRLKLNQ